MIDTIILTKRVDELESKQLSRIMELLDKKLIKADNGNDIESFFGYYKSIRISVDAFQIRIIGSLNVFFKDDNIKRVSFEEIYNGIKAFSIKLGVDLFSFKIARIDIGFNFVTQLSIEQLIRSVIEVPKLSRFVYKDGVYFKNGSRTLTFYDKKKEKKNKLKLPLIFDKSNLLRVEYRYAKNEVISNKLKIKNATFLDVLQNFNILINDFEATFQSIVWNSQDISHSYLEDQIINLKSFRKFLMAHGLKVIGGIEGAYKIIEEIKQQAKYFAVIDGMKGIVDDLCDIPLDSKFKTNYSEIIKCFNFGIKYNKLQYFIFSSRSQH